MAFFQLRSIPGTVWPQVPAPEVGQLWAAYLELERTQWLSAAEIEERQLEQARALLLHCFHQVPYYRRVMSEKGIAPASLQTMEDFRRLPILTRQLYQTHFEEIQARSLPADIKATGDGYTSGTNGVPIKVLKTSRGALWWHALFLRDLEWGGIDPRGRIAVIRFLALTAADLAKYLAGVSLPYWNETCHRLMETGKSYALEVRQDPRRQLQWLRRIDPEYLLSMPTNLEFLAGLVRESGEKLPALKAIQTIGETLSAQARAVIETSFGVPVKDLYSSTEAGYMASPCPAGHGYHAHSENILAEVLDDDNNPCQPGQTGQLVLTALHNFRAPFVRYAILDDVTLGTGPCPCGRGLPLWTRIDGRRHPFLHLPGGGRKIVSGLYLSIRRIGGFHQFQIIQRAAEHMILRVVPDQTWSLDHETRLRQAILDEFGSPIRVDIEAKECLERPPGGKLKIAVIEMEEGKLP